MCRELCFLRWNNKIKKRELKPLALSPFHSTQRVGGPVMLQMVLRHNWSPGSATAIFIAADDTERPSIADHGC